MKKLAANALAFAVSKEARPVEVWLLRLALAYLGVKMGVDAVEAAK